MNSCPRFCTAFPDVDGLGGESLYVGIDVLTTTWFLGSELGFSYGLVEVREGAAVRT